MGLESATYIDGLVTTNPVGATDPKSQGDDHIRLLKSTIKASFPNINAAVNPTPSDLNQLTGAATNGRIADIVALTDPNADRILFWDDSGDAVVHLSVDGTELTITGTELAISQLASSKLSGALPAISGAALTNLTAANVTGSHTLPNGVLSTDVPLYTDTAPTFLGMGTALYVKSSNTSGGWFQWGTSSTVRGYIGNGTLITGGSPGVGDVAIRAASGGLYFSGNDGTTAHLKLDSAGLVTTPNANAQEVGYKGAPVNSQSVDYTLVLADAGKWVQQTGSSKTVTIPANASVAFPVGTIILMYFSAAGSLAITSDTLILAGPGSTGTRTIAASSLLTIYKFSSTVWIVSGVGIS